MTSPQWKQVKGRAGWTVLAVVVVALLAFGIGRDTGAPTPQERVETISKRLACPICDGESVFESRNNASSAIRTEIKQQVAAGTATDDDIVTFIEQRYGGQVLLVPQATGFDSLVWALPAFAGVCAVAGLIVAFRRWKRAADTTPTDDDRAIVAAAREAHLDES
ncbi:MAG: cytochrome c-type biogenesis protein [Ilumatobacteraceae bacterium]